MNSGDDSDGLRRAGHAQQHADAAMGIVRPRFSSSGADLPAPVGAISYRPYAAGDERSMMAGFNESFGLNRGLDYWRWKHDRPAMASTIMLAVDETNAVQAQFAAMPFDWRMDGTTLRVGFVGDNFARRHPRLVRQNVFLRTIRAFHRQHAEAGGFAFLYGIPNEVVRRLHNVLLPSLGPHPVPYFLRRLDTGPHAPLPHGWRAQSRTPNADDVENLWLRTEAAYPRGAARNASWLNWRFVRRPDVVDYRFLHVMDPNGRVQAWAVLRQQGHTMWVCDLLWDHAQPLSLTALDAAIAKASIAAGAHANSMWFQGDAAGEILLSVHGWQPTPNPYPENLCFVVYDRQTDYTDLQRKVYFTLADSDHI